MAAAGAAPPPPRHIKPCASARRRACRSSRKGWVCAPSAVRSRPSPCRRLLPPPRAPRVHNLLEEDVVVAWHGSRCGEESVKTAVQPIIDWLQEASEEESDEDEEDDE